MAADTAEIAKSMENARKSPVSFGIPSPKTYGEFLDEISSDDLFVGLLGHGLFDDKLPPLFSSKGFCDYCLITPPTPSNKQTYDYVSYRCVRNIGETRIMGLPNPIGYFSLCRCLSDNWESIRQKLKEITEGQNHKVSRIHIRKQKNTPKLFEMNYGTWANDGDPVPEIQVTARYQVVSDITQCFPSIYSHAVPWALVGKDNAKKNRDDELWFNRLDQMLRKCTNGETHGILIGPSASSLVAEIILTRVDKVLLEKGFSFIRSIDDYQCFVGSYEDAEEFIRVLDLELLKFGLMRNQKKTRIMVLPVATEEEWPRALKSFPLPTEGKLTRGQVLAFLDFGVDLVKANGDNAAILNYALKMLSRREMTAPAAALLLSRSFQFVRLFPYLAPIMEEVVFGPFHACKNDIQRLSDDLYEYAKRTKTWFPAYYAFYYALKYDFNLSKAKVDDVIESDDCILKVLELCYAKKRKNRDAVKKLHDDAVALMEAEDVDQNWVFVYEALNASELKGDFAAMKKAKVSFVDLP